MTTELRQGIFGYRNNGGPLEGCGDYGLGQGEVEYDDEYWCQEV